MNLQEAERTIWQLEARRSTYEEELTDLRVLYDGAGDEVKALTTILEILRGMEESWRDRFQQGLETIVSRGLTAVFGDEIKVRLETTQHRDATSIAIKIEQGGFETDVMDAKGGSLVQVLSFLLIVLLIVSAEPPLRRVVILDEPFGMVSAHYFPALCELIKQLRARLGMQFILTTHNIELLACAERAYEVRAEGGQAHLNVLHLEGHDA